MKVAESVRLHPAEVPAGCLWWHVLQAEVPTAAASAASTCPAHTQGHPLVSCFTTRCNHIGKVGRDLAGDVPDGVRSAVRLTVCIAQAISCGRAACRFHLETRTHQFMIKGDLAARQLPVTNTSALNTPRTDLAPCQRRQEVGCFSQRSVAHRRRIDE